ncbi:DUF1654 domain-containing protein [Pseudomonas sp. G34]|uniref:DUF1654 domain-containing protein n=1 Tax=Pseudomonas sp. G34 TaxID=3059083 RepID=UPI002807C5FA|nr:DUF1654 domain-containing protein [Pseudomonas sp. G34]MDQ7987040.1 DUF1654 domain-containing protein [Pseudomonas sp. G34]
MGRQAAEAQDYEAIAPGSDQLARRVLAMVDSPVAWLGKRVRIHRLETDGDAEWGEVMDRLAATSGLQMDFEEAGSVILQWEKTEDLSISFGAGARPAEQAKNEAPF